MEAGWQFPLNNGGVGAGPNDGAVDHFKGSILSSVVREVIQNSLDAKDIPGEPVHVSFCLDHITSVDFSGFSEIKDFVAASKDQAKEQKLNHNVAYYENLLKIIGTGKKISVLSIHDWNTKGLTGPTNGKMVGNWYALTKGDGLTQKDGPGSLGSFGHGSKAPFTLSHSKSVFYYSLIQASKKTKEERFQGKCKLQSHIHPTKKKPTQSTGFYGNMDENLLPLIDSDVPDWFRKHRKNITDQTGTSLYIPYTRFTEDLFPETEITVVANFFYAIFNGQLEVTVGEQIIKRDNVIERYEWAKKAIENEQDYIDVDHIKECFESIETIINHNEKGYIQDPNFKRVDWFIRLSDELGAKRVGIARNTGMLITRQPLGLKQFPGTKLFDLFVCVSQPEGSEILKRMENPQHTEFSFQFIEDQKEQAETKKKYNALIEKIRNKIRQYASFGEGDEIDIDELADILNEVSNVSADKGERGNEMLLLDAPPKKQKNSTPHIQTDEEGSDTGSRGSGLAGGKGKKTGSGGNINDPKGTKLINEGDAEKVFDAGKKLPLENVRVTRSAANSKELTLYFSSSHAGAGLMKVQRVGELASEDLEFKVDRKNTKIYQAEGIKEGRNKFKLSFSEPVNDFVIEGSIVFLPDTEEPKQEEKNS